MASSVIKKHYNVVNFTKTTNSVGAFAFDGYGILIDLIIPLSEGDFFWSQYDVRSAKLYYTNGSPAVNKEFSGTAVFLV